MYLRRFGAKRRFTHGPNGLAPLLAFTGHDLSMAAVDRVARSPLSGVYF